MSMFSTLPHAARLAIAGPPESVLSALEAGTIPAHAFDHHAHVFAAWSAVRAHGVLAGSERFRQALLAYCTHLGARDKYHVTITEALLRLIVAEMAEEEAVDGPWQTAWFRFERQASYLLEMSRSALAPYYSNTLIADEAARRQFLPPDRKPLPVTELDALAVG
jgi:hypothetical protein